MGALLTQQNIRTLLLITCTVTYMLVGAAIFSALEYDKDQEERKKYLQIYRRLQRQYNISKFDMGELTRFLHKRKHVEYALEPWSFAGSVYFTAVTITTIGKSFRHFILEYNFFWLQTTPSSILSSYLILY